MRRQWVGTCLVLTLVVVWPAAVCASALVAQAHGTTGAASKPADKTAAKGTPQTAVEKAPTPQPPAANTAVTKDAPPKATADKTSAGKDTVSKTADQRTPGAKAGTGKEAVPSPAAEKVTPTAEKTEKAAPTDTQKTGATKTATARDATATPARKLASKDADKDGEAGGGHEKAAAGAADTAKKGPAKPEPPLEQVMARISALLAQQNTEVEKSGNSISAQRRPAPKRNVQSPSKTPPAPLLKWILPPSDGVSLKWDEELAGSPPSKGLGVRLVWPM